MLCSLHTHNCLLISQTVFEIKFIRCEIIFPDVKSVFINTLICVK